MLPLIKPLYLLCACRRFQKLRKKAGVTPLDPVEFYYDLSPPASGKPPPAVIDLGCCGSMFEVQLL